jgi:hypothetical protein
LANVAASRQLVAALAAPGIAATTTAADAAASPTARSRPTNGFTRAPSPSLITRSATISTTLTADVVMIVVT